MNKLLSQLQPGEAAIVFKGDQKSEIGVIRILDTFVMGSHIGVKKTSIGQPDFFDVHVDICTTEEAIDIISNYDGKDWLQLMYKEMAQRELIHA